MPKVLQDPGDKLSPDDFSSHFVTLKVKKWPHFPVKWGHFSIQRVQNLTKQSRLAKFQRRQTVIPKITPTRHFASHFWVKNDLQNDLKLRSFRGQNSKTVETPRRAPWFWESPSPDFQRNTISHGVSEKSSLKFLKIRNFRSNSSKITKMLHFDLKNLSWDWFLLKNPPFFDEKMPLIFVTKIHL